jgi:2-phosphoglycerate kinase
MTLPLDEIYWLGGSPCSGKSSVARILADTRGLNSYKCDDHMDTHIQAGAQKGLPVCSTLREKNHEYVFMRSHRENVQLPFDVYSEEFGLILEDLSSKPVPLLVEGCALLPAKLSELGVESGRAFYMIPTEDFFREQYALRTWAYDRLQETSDPEKAFENWMNRDVEFARLIEESARAHGFACMEVDGSRTLEQTAAEVARHLGLRN